MSASGIWYVEFPTYQYNEDVLALAKERGLTVIDARFDVGNGVKDAPVLTKKGESLPESRIEEPKKKKPDAEKPEPEAD